MDRVLAMSTVFNFNTYQVLPLAEMTDPVPKTVKA
jgi:hypothetical protein